MRSTGKIVSYASGSIPANLVSLAFGTYVQFYYIDQLKGDPKWIGLAAAIQAIYATVVYPFLGHLSDRTQSRWGRRVPFIIYGAVPLGVAFTLVWIPPVSASHVLLFTAYFFVTALFYDTMFNLTMVNWSALFPELFHSPGDRSYASAWKQMFGIVGLIAGLALPTMIAHAIGWPTMGVVFGVLSTITLFTTIPSMDLRKRAQERNAAPTTKAAGLSIGMALKHTLVNKSFVTFVGMRIFVQFAFTMLTANLSYYAEYNLKLNGTQQSFLLLGTLVVALPLVYVWGWLVPKIGASRSALWAVTLFGLALIPFFFAKSFMTALLCGMGLGIGLSGILILTDILISDVIDEDELKTGTRREGMFYGIHGLLIGLTTPAQAIITSWVLVSAHYVHGPVQPASALLGFRIMITLIPFIALVVGFCIFLRYPLRKPVVVQNQSRLNQVAEDKMSF